ncbi:DUF4253 domain-containing protein [Myceligenerans xiligouense]|uniref:Uncharacterized protein DUF4253 n=1 Tax=Myceligenerans xiligouense TaxID=253184 RepID=A0A3N4ZK81_9MICO|nr:DUF4253 domain-containing protein [Myceligenerans xiligouense]RPF21325.1 uncharacterized protein DUF4253 [Myceligenerans xiligouense]
MSDAPVDDAGASWIRLRKDHEQSGLYPVLLEHDDDRAWHDRWSLPKTVDVLEATDPETALRTLWNQLQDDREPEKDDEDEIPEDEWPSGPWPGLAPRGTGDADPWSMAEQYAAHLQDDEDFHRRPRRWHLGLIRAHDGASALTLAGWDGTCNHTNDTELISAALASWGERFGARVVGLGPDTLWLSVAHPPQNLGHALAVAREHFTFCPDNLWQGGHDTIDKYATALIGMNAWTFWWD